MQRDVLPMPDRPHEGLITYDAKDRVQLDIDEAAEDVDHLISPEELMRVAMSRQ